MSFDVFLIPSSATPNATSWAKCVSQVLADAGAKTSGDGVDVTLPDGASFELHASGSPGAMFALRGFAPSICEAVYRLADATSCFIVPSGGTDAALRTPGNSGEPPPGEGFPPIERVDSAAQLTTRLAPDFGNWSDFRDQVVSSSVKMEPVPPPKGFWARLLSKVRT